MRDEIDKLITALDGCREIECAAYYNHVKCKEQAKVKLETFIESLIREKQKEAVNNVIKYRTFTKHTIKVKPGRKKVCKSCGQLLESKEEI